MVIINFFVLHQPDERPDDLVDARYVARRFGCSISSVYAGKCGTGGIKPVSRDLWRAVRAQVEAEHMKLLAPAMPVPAVTSKKVYLVRRRAR
jgi:hypothetical protein